MLEFALQKKLHTADGEMQLSVDAQMQAGQFVSLYGSSGAGKTSVLRMLAGFMRPDGGYIKTSSGIWFDASQKIDIAPQQRNIGFVFQDYALFPNMNVRENIAFALPKKENKDIGELLELTGLAMLANRKTETLSGGQKQRVALARAIARRPQLLLLDEPLSAVDSNMRLQLQNTLLAVHSRFSLTTILVSHDMDEIMRLSDSIIHLENGGIQQHTTPSRFFAPKQETGVLNGYVSGVDHHNNQTTVTILLNTRMLKINTQQAENYAPGDAVNIIYNDGVPSITKA